MDFKLSFYISVMCIEAPSVGTCMKFGTGIGITDHFCVRLRGFDSVRVNSH